MAQNRSSAVMAQRRDPLDALDFYPTPPWATRTLVEHVIAARWPGPPLHGWRVWEPACGRGHMGLVLEEYGADVALSDVHDYRTPGQRVGSFVGEGIDVLSAPWTGIDAIITNPPFNLAVEFALRAIRTADVTALLVRTAWLEGADRYDTLFAPHPPTIIAQFAERVPMVKGRWDPEASTATAYAWVVWINGALTPTRFQWIPPGQRRALTRRGDIERFAEPARKPDLAGSQT